MKWFADTITIMPSVANMMSAMNSPLKSFRAERYARLYTMTSVTATRIAILSNVAMPSTTNMLLNAYWGATDRPNQ